MQSPSFAEIVEHAQRQTLSEAGQLFGEAVSTGSHTFQTVATYRQQLQAKLNSAQQ